LKVSSEFLPHLLWKSVSVSIRGRNLPLKRVSRMSSSAGTGHGACVVCPGAHSPEHVLFALTRTRRQPGTSSPAGRPPTDGKTCSMVCCRASRASSTLQRIRCSLTHSLTHSPLTFSSCSSSIFSLSSLLFSSLLLSLPLSRTRSRTLAPSLHLFLWS
jgi:hypothetical protein